MLTISTQRDEAWHEELCKRWDPVVSGFAARQLPPWQWHLIDDIGQQVRETTWRKRSEVPDEPRAWLYTTTAMIAANVRRFEDRHQRNRDDSDLATLPAQASPEDQIAARAAWHALVASLEPVDQQILDLIINEHFTHEEVAEALQPLFPNVRLSVANVAQRKLRALRRLRAHIEQDPLRFTDPGDQP